MSRAEAAAMKAYPEEKHLVCGPLPGGDMHEFDDNAGLRKVYAEGYEQAEKELALTWEDIKEIQRLLDVVWSEQDVCAPIDEDTIYKEVLRRFKEAKK